MANIPGQTNGDRFQDFSTDWWGQVLGQYEPGQYFSSYAGRDFGARSPRRQRYFQDAYQDIMKDYYGAAGASMRKGQDPVSFMEYLETDPWTARYSRLPQTARGTTGMMSSPRTRFLYNY